MKLKHYIILGLLLITLFIFFTCKKDEPTPEGGNKIEIGSTTIDSYSYYTATISTTLTSTGGNKITQHGHCWSTNNEPTTEDDHTQLGSKNETGKFTSEIDGLESNTKYYIKPYTNHSLGTVYGETKDFSTINTGKPIVKTSDVTDITIYTVTCGGNVENDSGSVVTARGVCWNKTGNPSLENFLNYTIDGSGMGGFSSNVTELQEISTYFIKAYATNENGTAYGEERSFVTLAACGALILNYDGQVYHTVEIGNQCWFKENLNIGEKIYGSQNQQNNSTVEKYCYNDSESNCDEYGGLYRWDEAMQYVTNEGAKGICPEGWHIPTDDEWDVLVNFLGGSGVAGGKMKETGTAHWNSPNTDATNSSGFTGLAGGGHNFFSSSFYDLGYYGNILSSSDVDASHAWTRRLYYDANDVFRTSQYKTEGFSVRCLQN